MAALTAVAVLGTPLSARASAAPSLVRVTSTNGRSVPAPLATGDWTPDAGVWVLDSRSIAPVSGETSVTAAWHPPSFTARKGMLVFAADITLQQEPAPGAYTFSDDVRVCTPAYCGPWMDESSGTLPAWVDPATLPFTVQFGHGISVIWKGATTKLHVEWRYNQTQRDGNYARTTIRVAAGAAAKSV